MTICLKHIVGQAFDHIFGQIFVQSSWTGKYMVQFCTGTKDFRKSEQNIIEKNYENRETSDDIENNQLPDRKYRN